MAQNKLLILWSSADREVAKKMVLLYGSVILPRGYWDEAHLMIWGPSSKLLAEDAELQEMLKTVLDTGVTASTCVVCTDDYGVTDTLSDLGVEPNHTGELFTEALQNDWKVITL
jgi:hypothetical protein